MSEDIAKLEARLKDALEKLEAANAESAGRQARANAEAEALVKSHERTTTVERTVSHHHAALGMVRPIVMRIYDLGPDHPTKMRYELQIIHPEKSLAPGNDSKQQPEIFRFLDEKKCREVAAVYESILDNATRALPAEAAPRALTAG